jgi:hypothetical protein
MSHRKPMQQVVGVVLLLLTLLGCSALTAAPTAAPTPIPTPDMTPGQVKGVLVSKATGQPLEITPALFTLTEGMTPAEKAALEANVVEVEVNSSGEFLIKNVLPGQHALMIDYNVVSAVFTVSPGQTTDLGTIEVE